MAGDADITRLAAQINRVEQHTIVMTDALREMTVSIKTLTESQIRREERESRQAEINTALFKFKRETEQWRQDLDLKRAAEEPARAWLSKWWPTLGAVGVLSASPVIEAVKDIFK
jgi:hypothetical protein